MKVRLIEFRFDRRAHGFPSFARSVSDRGLHRALSDYDPGITDGWIPVETDGQCFSAKARSRQFFDVESVEEQPRTNELPGDGEQQSVPGTTLMLKFGNGETLRTHNAMVAECYRE